MLASPGRSDAGRRDPRCDTRAPRPGRPEQRGLRPGADLGGDRTVETGQLDCGLGQERRAADQRERQHQTRLERCHRVLPGLRRRVVPARGGMRRPASFPEPASATRAIAENTVRSAVTFPSIDWIASSSTFRRRRISRGLTRADWRSSSGRRSPFASISRGASACTRSRSRSHSWWISNIRRSFSRPVRRKSMNAWAARQRPGASPLSAGSSSASAWLRTSSGLPSRSTSVRARLPAESAASRRAVGGRHPRLPLEEVLDPRFRERREAHFLAARANGRRESSRARRGEHPHRGLPRLLQRLEQRGVLIFAHAIGVADHHHATGRLEGLIRQLA